MNANQNEKTGVEQILRNVKTMPIYKQLIPMEAISGWLIPFRKGGRTYITIPYCGAMPLKPGKTKLYPPLALLTIDVQTGIPVQYVNTRYSNPWPEGKWSEAAGSFPHDAIAKMLVHEYKEKRARLKAIYDEMISCMNDDRELDPALDREFHDIINLLVDPGLKPFYTAIAPGFFGRYFK